MAFPFAAAAGLAGSAISAFGGNKAAGQLADATNRASQPLGIQSPLGLTSMRNGVLDFQPTLRGEQMFRQTDTFRNRAFQDLNKFSRDDFSSKFFDAIDRLESRREADNFANFESALFNRSGVNSGTARHVADFQQDIGDARLSRVLQSQLAAEDVFNNRAALFGNAVNMSRGLNSDVMGQLSMSQAGRPNPQLAAMGGAARSNATANFFSGLGTNVGNVLSGLPDILSSFGGGSAPGTRPEDYAGINVGSGARL